VFSVLCHGLPGGGCDGWLIAKSTHLWWLLCTEYLSSSPLLSRHQIVVQLRPFTENLLLFNRCLTCYGVFSRVGTLSHCYRSHFPGRSYLCLLQHWTGQYFVFSFYRILTLKDFLFSRTYLCILPQILSSQPESPCGLQRLLLPLLNRSVSFTFFLCSSLGPTCKNPKKLQHDLKRLSLIYIDICTNWQ